MLYTRQAGLSNFSVDITILDDTSGARETGVVAATAGLSIYYRRVGGAVVTLSSINNLSALTDAHNDEGLLHIQNGTYRLDLPNAAVAGGATGVIIGGSATGMVILESYVELVRYDPQDFTRLGLTALPNADADAAGGLPISDAGGLDLDNDNLTQTNAALDAAISELGVGIPTSTPSIRTALMLFYMAYRNQIIIDTSSSPGKTNIYNNAGTLIAQGDTTDAASIFTRTKLASG